MTKLSASVLLTVILTTPAQAAVDGQWTIHLPDNNAEVILELKTDGARLTGSLSGGPGKHDLLNGSISADTISFEARAQPRRGVTVTIQFTGKIHSDTMDLTVRPQESAPKSTGPPLAVAPTPLRRARGPRRR